MEQQKMRWACRAPPVKVLPFLQKQGQPAGGQGPAAPQKNKIGFTWLDSVFAPVFLAVGWLFWELQAFHEWFRFSLAGFGTAVFCALYVAVVLGYVYLAGKKPPRESWFWLGIVLCLGFAYALPYGGTLLGLLHYAALLLAAQYWTLCAAGRLLKQGKTSNWLLLDLFNAGVILPWGNFMRLPRRALGGGKAAGRPPEKCAQQRAEGRGGKTRVCGAGRRAGGVFVPLPCASAADAGRRGVCRPAGRFYTAGFPALWKTCSAR